MKRIFVGTISIWWTYIQCTNSVFFIVLAFSLRYKSEEHFVLRNILSAYLLYGVHPFCFKTSLLILLLFRKIHRSSDRKLIEKMFQSPINLPTLIWLPTHRRLLLYPPTNATPPPYLRRRPNRAPTSGRAGRGGTLASLATSDTSPTPRPFGKTYVRHCALMRRSVEDMEG